jgi:hypothetical protein
MTRQCGSCTLCCKLIPVEELHKAAGQRCQHVRAGKGCSIYARRPFSCREWSCLWLKGTENGEPLALSRPDRSHYVLDEVPDIVRVTDNVTGAVRQVTVMQVWCDPKFPDAWKDEGLLDMLQRGGIVALVRYDSTRGFGVFPPSASTDGQWHYSDSTNTISGDLEAARTMARHEFWSKQL